MRNGWALDSRTVTVSKKEKIGTREPSEDVKKFLFYTLLVLVVIAGAVAGGAWWVVQRALPDVNGTATLAGLEKEVIVERDVRGVPHIRAQTEDDLFVAQGYVMAQDRLWQMDVLRRVAAGELSEIFGPVGIERDKEYRTLGFTMAAERDAEALDELSKKMLAAYTRGVNLYIEERRGRLPWEFVALRYEPRPWKESDSLLISAYMYRTLTNTWETELRRAQVLQAVDADRAKDLYRVDSQWDRVIVGEAVETAQKSEAKNAMVAWAGRGMNFESGETQKARPSAGYWEKQLWSAVEALAGPAGGEAREGLGSNNWVVDGRHTASGKPLLANDTHLTLAVPGIWYLVHLTGPSWNVKGFALPGAPGVIIGHNERIAWGFTNNGADVQDLYIETFHPDNPRQYRVNGGWVEAQVRTERVKVRGEADTLFDVTVTRHGPIVQMDRESRKGFALRWTATEPGGLNWAFSTIGRSQNWEEFLAAMRKVPGPAQNAVYADVEGNIGFIVAANIPVRRRGDGSVPVPGDTDEYEWGGFIPFERLPQVLNPPGGRIATANARVVGPGYPYYLTDRWASPYRTARIYQLLGKKAEFQPEDFVRMQMDILSIPHGILAGELVKAAAVAPAKNKRAQQLIARLGGWDGQTWADSQETLFLELTRQEVMRNLLRPYLGDSTGLYEWRTPVFLESVLRERPARWLPKEFLSFDALLTASADEAAARIEQGVATAGAKAEVWGWANALVMAHPLSNVVPLKWVAGWLNIGPTQQSGTAYTVKAAQRSHGPAMWFVADLGDFDQSLVNLPLGESGQLGSLNYRDMYETWSEGRGVASPFTDAAWEKARVHRLTLLPRR